MKREVENQLDQKLIDAIVKFNSLLRESFIKKEKISIKIDVPKFEPKELTNYRELKTAIECLRHNYREMLRYIKLDNYTPLLKIVFLYEEENSFPVILNLDLQQYLESDFFVGKEILNIKKIM